jgi:hypothetical protein
MPPAAPPSLQVPIKESVFWPTYGVSVPQAAFLSLPHMEALYGGAAGGGKSDALLRAALQYVEFPAYKAILFRKTFSQLSQAGGLIDRSKEWLTGKATWNETKHRWTFPSGAILEFGHLQHENDRFNYQGAEFDFIGFDELTHFTEIEYRYLFSRLRRRVDSPIPGRMRSASNPGGKGHRWVKRRFIERKPDPDDLGDTPEKCAERIFIPAKLTDNPGIDQVGYEAALKQLDPQEQEQLLDGNWDARQPGPWVFDSKAIDAAVELGTEYDRLRSIEQMVAPVDHAVQSGIDFGDFATAFEPIWPLERGGIYVPPGEIATSRVDVEDIALQALAAMAAYPFWWSESRYDASFAQSNRTFIRVARQALGEHNIVTRSGRPNSYPVRFNEYKLLAVRYIRLLLRRTLEAKEAGWPPGEKLTRLLAISPQAVRLIEQMRDYQEDEQDKFQKGNDDHVDALIAGVTPVARKHRAVVEKEIAEAKRKAALAQPQKPVSTPPGATERLEIRGG